MFGLLNYENIYKEGFSYETVNNNEERNSKVWLIVEWKTQGNSHNGYQLVSSDDLADNLKIEDFHTGKVVNVNTNNGKKQACIVIVSADKPFLEMEIKHLQDAVNQIGLTKRPAIACNSNVKRQKIYDPQDENTEEYLEDFADSASDWNPNSEEDSEAENNIRNKNKKRTPRNKANQKRIKTIQPKRKSNLKQEIIIEQSTKSTPQNNMNRLKIQPDPYAFPGNNSFGIEPRQYQPIGLGEHRTSQNLVYNQQRRQSYVEAPAEEYYKVPPMTFDQQTQTNLSNCDPSVILMQKNQKLMGDDIAYLHRTVEAMRQKINGMQLIINQLQCNKYENNHNTVTTSEENYVQGESYIAQEEPNSSVLRESNNIVNNIEIVNSSESYILPLNTPVTQHVGNNNTSQTNITLNESINNSMNNTNNTINMSLDDTDNISIPIGSGKTLVPRHVYNQIKWTSYSSATRKLLMAVFPRKTLATHSLTGKSSPAFTDKPPKMQLDARKVTDIIMTVSQMCNVPENLVRNTITTKCADENKMFRMRKEKMRNRKGPIENEENHSP